MVAIKKWIVAAAAVVTLVTCSSDAPPSIVHSGITPAVWTLDTVPLLTIGRADSHDPVYALHQVGDVWILPGLRIAVASERRMVQIFDSLGRFQHGFGRDGDGPTEFRDLYRVLLEGDSILLAIETLRPRVSRWRLNGDLVSEFRYDMGRGVELSGPGFAVPSSGSVMTVAVPTYAAIAKLVEAQPGTPTTSGFHQIQVASALIVLAADRVDTLSVVVAGRTYFYRHDQGGLTFDGSTLYARPTVGQWGQGGAFTNGANGMVEFYDRTNRLAARVETDRTGVPISRDILEALERARDEVWRGRGASPPPDQPEFPAPERLPVYTRIPQDGLECVWLQRYRVPGIASGEVDVVHPRRGGGTASRWSLRTSSACNASTCSACDEPAKPYASKATKATPAVRTEMRHYPPLRGRVPRVASARSGSSGQACLG